MIDGYVVKLQEEGAWSTNKVKNLSSEEIEQILGVESDATTAKGLLYQTYFLITINIGEQVGWHYTLTVDQFKKQWDEGTRSNYYIIHS